MSSSYIRTLLYKIIRDRVNLSLVLFILVILLFRSNMVNSVIHRVDYNALSVVSCFILVSRGLIVGGFIDNLASGLVARSRGSTGLGLSLIAASYLLSTVASNDGAVLIMTPIAASASRMVGLDPALLVIPVILAANSGSMLTAFGNPQNIIIWQHYRLDAWIITYELAPLSLAGLVMLGIYISVIRLHGKDVPRLEYPRIKVNRKITISSAVLLAVDILLGDIHLGIYAFILTLVVFSILDYRLLKSVDWSLILSFLLMFIGFGALSQIISTLGVTISNPLHVYILSILLSQTISNVPATIALTGLTSSWKPLLVGVNIGGYITPVGSIANILGLRLAGIKWRRYITETLWFSALMLVLGLLTLLNA